MVQFLLRGGGNLLLLVLWRWLWRANGSTLHQELPARQIGTLHGLGKLLIDLIVLQVVSIGRTTSARYDVTELAEVRSHAGFQGNSALALRLRFASCGLGEGWRIHLGS